VVAELLPNDNGNSKIGYWRQPLTQNGRERNVKPMNTAQRRKSEVAIQRAHVGTTPCPHCGVRFTGELMPLHIKHNHAAA
jgi:hypothetical protein